MLRWLQTVSCGLVASLGAAERPGAAEVPPALAPWRGWALRGHEAALCPFLDGSPDATRCAWPGALDLRLDARAGRFAQRWRMHAAGFAPLPGDERRFPLDVRVDGAPATVVPRDGVPWVRLSPGDHAVAGAFAWDALPESIRIAPETGVVTLAIAGRPVEFPERDAEGRLFLQKTATAGPGDERLEIAVHRRVVDDVPLLVVTRAELRVSGKSREVLLGKALLQGFVPLAIDSPLPARLEADGRLRVQVRPGTFAVEVRARHDGPAAALALAAPGGPWAADETWVFEAQPRLRLCDVEGVPQIDPQQTTLPDEWKRLPAFRVAPGDTMRLGERRRGDADPAADRLRLGRTLWLDFDGGGYTARDAITGTLRRSWRLEMGAETELGRVLVDGQPQLITRMGKSGLAGVEVRQGQVSLVAESRVAGRRFDLPAVGWNHDFHDVAATLRLPPGWVLAAALGAHDVPGTWVRRWTLLDLFLVLIVALAAGRLWGRRTGAAVLATMALCVPEPDAPRWVWVAVLAAEGLCRIAGEGRAARALALLRLGTRVALVIVAVPFVVAHLRHGMYPALEQAESPRGIVEVDALAPAAPAGKAESTLLEGKMMLQRGAGQVAEQSEEDYRRQRLLQNDPKANVQTGPGLPNWTGDEAAIGFSPVDRTQRLRLLLVPPWMNLLLAFVRVALLAWFAARVLGVRLRRPPAGVVAAAAALAAVLLAPGAARADLPTPEMIEDLRARLVERPECAPRCASAPRLWIDAGPAHLAARLEVGAAAATALPLPGGAEHWLPARVLLDGAPAPGRLEDGVLWIDLPRGTHQVLLDGPLPAREVVQIPLPLRPHRVEARVTGWTLEGLHEDGLCDDALLLTRARAETDAKGALAPGTLPPFVRVERAIVLGLTWQVETRVVRVSPPGAGIALEVPLIEGESVLTADLRVRDGKALVALAPQASEIAWTSALDVRARIALAAPREVAWTEVWRLEAGPVWHVDARGLAPVQPAEDAPLRVPEWRPWPGEALALEVVRPSAVPGATLTIDRSLLTLRPGFRATDAKLALSLRSSRGGEHRVTLPAGAALESVTVDERLQPIRQEGRTVTLPVAPGARGVEIAWREKRGLSWRFAGSEVDVGAPNVNAEVHVGMPPGRWTLLAGGPRVGPAVLFWSLLAALLLCAAGLARVPWTPLRVRHWALLGVGLSQVPIEAAAIAAGWLLALGWRRRRPDMGRMWFDLRQVALVAWTVAALAVIGAAIHAGLLGTPEMQIRGNGSSSAWLRWFEDRSGARLARPWVVSVPIGVYRVAMLAWALWIAQALLAWLRWGWGCFTEGGGWRRLRKPRPAGDAPAAPA